MCTLNLYGLLGVALGIQFLVIHCFLFLILSYFLMYLNILCPIP